MTTTPEETQDLPPAPVAEELSNESPAWWVSSKGDFTQDQEVVRRAAKFGHVWEPLYKSSQTAVPDVEALAQFIRKVHSYHAPRAIGAGFLAEKIAEWLEVQQ